MRVDHQVTQTEEWASLTLSERGAYLTLSSVCYWTDRGPTGFCTVAELAELAGVTHGHMKKLIRRLVALGLVARQGRFKITPHGDRVWQVANRWLLTEPPSLRAEGQLSLDLEVQV